MRLSEFRALPEIIRATVENCTQPAFLRAVVEADGASGCPPPRSEARALCRTRPHPAIGALILWGGSMTTRRRKTDRRFQLPRNCGSLPLGVAWTGDNPSSSLCRRYRYLFRLGPCWPALCDSCRLVLRDGQQRKKTSGFGGRDGRRRPPLGRAMHSRMAPHGDYGPRRMDGRWWIGKSRLSHGVISVG